MESGALHGVRICRRALVVSRLYFTDDTIIFGGSSEAELEHDRAILVNYEVAFGQAINLSKSRSCSVEVFQLREGTNLNRLLGTKNRLACYLPGYPK